MIKPGRETSSRLYLSSQDLYFFSISSAKNLDMMRLDQRRREVKE
jgi:hypothetical protein